VTGYGDAMRSVSGDHPVYFYVPIIAPIIGGLVGGGLFMFLERYLPAGEEDADTTPVGEPFEKSG
jgi:glycerol uptake facilitator protein